MRTADYDLIPTKVKYSLTTFRYFFSWFNCVTCLMCHLQPLYLFSKLLSIQRNVVVAGCIYCVQWKAITSQTYAADSPILFIIVSFSDSSHKTHLWRGSYILYATNMYRKTFGCPTKPIITRWIENSMNKKNKKLNIVQWGSVDVAKHIFVKPFCPRLATLLTCIYIQIE